MSDPVPFEVGGGPILRGEVAGEGPPAVLCHGLTATRRYVLHGSRGLTRAGCATIAYDARGHGASDPADDSGYGYPALIADLERLLTARPGAGAAPLLVGHSMGAHTAAGFALGAPGRVAGLVLVGPTYAGEIGGLDGWDRLADGLERDGIDGFLAVIAEQQGESPWRDSVLRFSRERMELHRDLGAIAAALRAVPRSRPFGQLDDLAAIECPVLVVGSGDEADPGHPRAVAEAYAEAITDARFAIEDPGDSPLAWQGGRLAREIAAFAGRIGLLDGGP